MWAAGVPERYWHATEDQIAFTEFQTGTKGVTVKSQREIFQSLLDGSALSENTVIGIGSAPSDDLAMAAGSLIVQSALDTDVSVDMLDVGFARLDDLPKADAVLLHNVTVDMDPPRMRHVRDLLRAFEGMTRIVLYAGPSPIEFFEEKLRHHIDAGLYVRSFAGNSRYVRRKRSV